MTLLVRLECTEGGSKAVAKRLGTARPNQSDSTPNRVAPRQAAGSHWSF